MARPQLHLPENVGIMKFRKDDKDPNRMAKYDARTARLKKLILLNAPAGIIANEALLLAMAVYSPDGSLRGLVDYIEDENDRMKMEAINGTKST